MNELAAICDEFSIELIEDGAEALGSLYHGEHVEIDPLQAFILLTEIRLLLLVVEVASQLMMKSLLQKSGTTTTAKQPHEYEYLHDELKLL